MTNMISQEEYGFNYFLLLLTLSPLLFITPQSSVTKFGLSYNGVTIRVIRFLAVSYKKYNHLVNKVEIRISPFPFSSIVISLHG